MNWWGISGFPKLHEPKKGEASESVSIRGTQPPETKVKHKPWIRNNIGIIYLLSEFLCNKKVNLFFWLGSRAILGYKMEPPPCVREPNPKKKFKV